MAEYEKLVKLQKKKLNAKDRIENSNNQKSNTTIEGVGGVTIKTYDGRVRQKTSAYKKEKLQSKTSSYKKKTSISNNISENGNKAANKRHNNINSPPIKNNTNATEASLVVGRTENTIEKQVSHKENVKGSKRRDHEKYNETKFKEAKSSSAKKEKSSFKPKHKAATDKNINTSQDKGTDVLPTIKDIGNNTDNEAIQISKRPLNKINKGDYTAKENEEAPKKYKRTDSKYLKEKEERTRSNPKFEYMLDDADKSEKEIIMNGTINDRINCLALLCARNPSEKNFKQLLMFCERQRNDVIYLTLKLLRDLSKEVKIESSYIKSRIVKSFEMGAKNQYIKDKVLEIIGVLIRANVSTEELINILVSRLIEKGQTLVIVENAIKSIFLEHKQMIFDGIEDFFFKNDSFRCQHNVLKFLQDLDTSNDQNFFRFFDSALSSLGEYPQEQKDQMVELIVNGLSKSYYEGELVSNIEFLRGYVKSARSSISVLSLLVKTSDPYTEAYVLKISRTSLLRNTKYETEFLNIVYRLDNKDMFAKLVDNSYFYSVPSILSLMLIAHEKNVDSRYLFSLRLFMMHFNPLVRDVAKRLLNREKIQKFDPFDKVYVDGKSKVLGNIE